MSMFEAEDSPTEVEIELPRPIPDNQPWNGRVVYGGQEGEQIAFRPGELLVRTQVSTNVNAVLDEIGLAGSARAAVAERWMVVSVPVGEELYWVERLKGEGFWAEPNLVFFADSFGANPIHANPIHANPIHANPIHANPIHANPIHANPIHANPIHANSHYPEPVYPNPIYGNPVLHAAFKLNGLRPSTARPADAPQPCGAMPKGTSSHVIILDTGLAAPGGTDVPDAADGWLDPVAGHGTFIAGLVYHLGRPASIVSLRLLNTFGDVDQLTAGSALSTVVASTDAQTIVNMSFSGYSRSDIQFMGDTVRDIQRAGGVVVASAGNSACSRRTFPASLPGVVSVGGLGAWGPAWFTNFGEWVRACAPAADVVSQFFTFNGANVGELDAMGDPDNFAGWARWSGTSFAAPIVVAALVREMERCQITAKEAVEAVIDAPGLHRIPGLGTVINMALAPSA